jgi:adenosylcobinamide kinase/adenosylcobinamide-phosphate guanylyltransferase
MQTGKLTLVLGGARSGKSRHAEALVTLGLPPWTYVATAQVFDDEMRARVDVHRARRTDGWVTIEAPIDVAAALGTPGPVLVDCLTLWLTNVMLAELDVEAETARLEAALAGRALAGRAMPTVLVSSEVGLGIVPDNALARRFRDAAGVLHQRLAAQADAVVMMVAGLPLKVK